MFKVFMIVSILILIDLLFLKVMPKFYIKIGIPIYKSTIPINKSRSLKDIGVYMGISENFMYKILDNILLYRTKFSYSILCRRFGFLSIVKGEITLQDNNAKIVQRINLTTVFFAFLLAYIIIIEKIDVLGYIFLGVILLIIFLAHLVKNVQIAEVVKDAETYMNQERKSKSKWGD